MGAFPVNKIYPLSEAWRMQLSIQTNMIYLLSWELHLMCNYMMVWAEDQWRQWDQWGQWGQWASGPVGPVVPDGGPDGEGPFVTKYIIPTTTKNTAEKIYTDQPRDFEVLVCSVLLIFILHKLLFHNNN